ncbi:hypothetical protein [Mesobacillus subterraneus]|uniref:Uncharacterized protein n=1 Tax=Mesobacillus subterraneus TaxID=285983 RepID=A0A427TE46_9BACI|nr:hypothetical protein [Mesobacillus subterraneus]RSD21066.1 hypothetical protein EJA10_22465 [Mesobacillus subterraneus]
MDYNEQDSKLKWNDRDWKWVIGVLISIIILILTIRLGDNHNVINLFSFISSSVSIALALVAIFIALKQDGESRRVNYLTSRILSSIELKLNTVDENLRRIDEKFIQNVTEEAIEEITAEGKKESYTKDEVKEMLSSLSTQITKEVNIELDQNNKKSISRPSSGLMGAYKLHYTIKKILQRDPSYSNREIQYILNEEFDIEVSIGRISSIKEAILKSMNYEKKDTDKSS